MARLLLTIGVTMLLLSLCTAASVNSGSLEQRELLPGVDSAFRGGCHRWGKICDCKTPTVDQAGTEFPGFCKKKMTACMQFWCH
ncbi:hypothetical protein RvY_03876-3 [Ramazzottius varieornatus]|uniref:Uncharacterized protein n=1 Tax=Ramazzottius varieornatus TaxID=947166 RepID=A0A1D1UQD6_RAMVA|nr:hypothetical protein RvY_03876-3 [Ramazzottius varieornatus]